MAHTAQLTPDSGPGFQVQVLEFFFVVPSSLESKPAARWSTTFSPKVKSPHEMDFSAPCGANLVT